MPALTALERIYESAEHPYPADIAQWEGGVSAWVSEYLAAAGDDEILEVVVGPAAFLFASGLQRVILAFGVSAPEFHKRAAGRMRGFPDVNIGVRSVLGSDAKPYDRGHFLGHASGGELDINLFPHERALNRGWSREGKAFRCLERLAAKRSGTFFFHRPLYVDSSWIPDTLDYGVRTAPNQWEIGRFANR